MMTFSRTDQSIVGRWWWTVDRWTLAVLAMIAGMGAILLLAASPAIATRIGIDDSMHFVKRQLLMMPPALAILIGVSLLSPIQVRRLAFFAFLGCVGLLVIVLLVGAEIKGARRWISLPGMSLQPSEFAKPCFAVLCAWMFAEQRKGQGFPGNIVACLLYGLTAGLLIAQPDLGQAVVVTAVFFAQFFLAGLPMALVVGLGLMGVGGVVGAYLTLPHVQSRVDRFLDPQSGDSYQIERAMEAFGRGGLWGRGPGEGTVKSTIPDAHADFVFAVAGEEFGLIACLILVSLFAFVVLRSFARLAQGSDLFALLAGAGLVVQFGLQALINMGSTLHLIPTKGMTLPFVSYGGSSMLALALGMGMLLALTRRRFGGPSA
jgi:cell division protein FtsW